MADQTIREIAAKILSLTNMGMDLIRDIYPQATEKKNFRIRADYDDKNESASLYICEKSDKRYRLFDHGGTVKGEDCFGLYALENHLSYTEAVLEIAQNLENINGYEILEKSKPLYKHDYRTCKAEDFAHELNAKGFHYIKKEFSAYELGILGPELKPVAKNAEGEWEKEILITPEVCERVNLFSLDEYSTLSKDKKTVHTFKSTDKFPILAFINQDDKIGEWVKIYAPKAGKKYTDDGKDYRFKYLGGNPKGFVFGLDYIKETFEDAKAEELERLIKTAKTDKEQVKIEIEHDKNFKLERICIATGGSDGLNLLALGEKPVWFNSETAVIPEYQIKELQKLTHSLINIPDNDTTGIREGRRLALEYMDVKTLWLSDYFDRKDFKDFTRAHQSLTKTKLITKTKEILEAAKPAQFWEVNTSEKGRISYSMHPIFSFYFLKLNGFARIEDRTNKDGYSFVRILGNVVEETDITQMKNFFKDFLQQKQKMHGVKKIPYALLNMLITSPKLSDSTFSQLDMAEPDFTDYEKDAQYFFLGPQVLKVTKDGTTNVKSERFVMKDQMIDELVFEETETKLRADKFEISKEPFSTVKEIGDNFYNVEVHRKDSPLQNLFIQTSRVHWNTQRKNYIKNGKSEKQFYDETLFDLGGKYLTSEEIDLQNQHYANKKFSFGYMLHRYKDGTKPWAPTCVDEAVLDDNVAEGGAGKTLIFKALSFFCNVFEINGKEDIEADKFLLEGVTQHTDFIVFDDVKRDFDFGMLYQITTGKMTINTKFMSKIRIRNKNSAKIGVSTNFSLRDRRGSTTRRTLLLGFSDYYHAENEERKAREPKDDFGMTLFDDYTQEQWFADINFAFECLQFYLGSENKINAPQEKIMMRAYLSDITESFHDWANGRFPDIIDQDIVKIDLFSELSDQKNKFLKDTSAKMFTKKVDLWCKIHGYEVEYWKKNMEQYDEFNQPIMRNNTHWKKTTDFMKIVPKKENTDEENTDDNLEDDMP